MLLMYLGETFYLEIVQILILSHDGLAGDDSSDKESSHDGLVKDDSSEVGSNHKEGKVPPRKDFGYLRYVLAVALTSGPEKPLPIQAIPVRFQYASFANARDGIYGTTSFID